MAEAQREQELEQLVREESDEERLQAFPAFDLNAGLKRLDHDGHVGARLTRGFRLIFQDARDW